MPAICPICGQSPEPIAKLKAELARERERAEYLGGMLAVLEHTARVLDEIRKELAGMRRGKGCV